MTEPTGVSKTISCAEAMLLLEKRMSEEPLSGEEQQRVRQHLNDCPRCREFVLLTSSLSRFTEAVSDTEDELDAAVRNVMSRVRRNRAAGRRTLARWVAVGGAAAAAAILATFFVQPFAGKAPLAPEAFPCVPVEPVEVVSGVYMSYCDSEEPGAIIENGGEVKVTLRSGTVGLFIDPRRPNKRKAAVETPLAEVRAKGTVFTVRVDREDELVEVFRGIVEVVPAGNDAAAYEVEAGHGAAIREGRPFRLSAPRTAPLKRTLLAAAVAADDVRDREGERSEAEEKEGMSAEAGTDGTEVLSGTAPPRGTNGTPKRSGASIDSLIQQAQSCLIGRDWTCAESRYQEVLRRYSGRPESLAVLISLAKIELRHLNAPQKALFHYKTYQLRAPAGPLSEEAQYGIAASHGRLGNREKEEEALRDFISAYPRSSLQNKARARLAQLGGR